MLSQKSLQEIDPEIFNAIQKERQRQEDHIELIGSENFTSPAVLEAAGTVLTNKYAEGYPEKRYYGGCDYVDIAEQLAIDRAKSLFKAEHANVQPHSGSQANTAVYVACLNPGDKILAMSLDHGGHLTHGHPKNISGYLFNVVGYGVNVETGYIDYDAVEHLAQKERPKMIVAGASAYTRRIDFERMHQIAKSCGALFMVDMAHIAGLVATGLHPSPIGYADFVTSTTHKTLRGPRGGLILCKEEHAKKIDAAVFPGIQGGPLMHILAAKGVCFHEALKPSFADYQNQVVRNARALSESLSARGFHLVTGGTDNHLLLIDFRKSHPDLTGKMAQQALDRAHITTNRNTIPGETRSPFQTSGLRLGTPAVTTRGMTESDMVKIADAIENVLESPENQAFPKARAIAKELCLKYPLPYKGVT